MSISFRCMSSASGVYSSFTVSSSWFHFYFWIRITWQFCLVTAIHLCRVISSLLTSWPHNLIILIDIWHVSLLFIQPSPQVVLVPLTVSTIIQFNFRSHRTFLPHYIFYQATISLLVQRFWQTFSLPLRSFWFYNACHGPAFALIAFGSLSAAHQAWANLVLSELSVPTTFQMETNQLLCVVLSYTGTTV